MVIQNPVDKTLKNFEPRGMSNLTLRNMHSLKIPKLLIFHILIYILYIIIYITYTYICVYVSRYMYMNIYTYMIEKLSYPLSGRKVELFLREDIHKRDTKTRKHMYQVKIMEATQDFSVGG